MDSESFTRVVDKSIRSSTSSDFGASSLHSFSSIVDRAIRSDTASDFGPSPVHAFVLANRSDRLSGPYHPAWLELEALSHQKSLVAAPLFTLAKLKATTNNFSPNNIIGAGSFGVVYKGKPAWGGRKVAIKRAKTWSNRPTPIFNSELLAFLLLLDHKHLVRLVGFCEEQDERLLVYEYVKNGTLHHHLHEKRSSVLNSWKMRINIALGASLGIEYLHNNYEGRSVIHGNVKCSNILLDGNWNARVSDFGLTFMNDTIANVGYNDPEYSGGGTLTAKSDVYGLGVILLELLTGKTAKAAVEIAVPAILSGYFWGILDPRVGNGPLDENEVKALKLVASTACNCVKFESKDRPIMPNVVVNLKEALAICDKGKNQQQLPLFWGVRVERKRETLRKIKG